VPNITSRLNSSGTVQVNSNRLSCVAIPGKKALSALTEEGWNDANVNRKVISRTEGRKEFPVDMSKIIWPRITPLEHIKGYMLVTGGLNEETNEISNQCLELNEEMYATRRSPMPEPRYGHAQVIVKDKLYVTGGISDMMHEMGMRSIPLGKHDCFKYDMVENKWTRLPEVPIGRLFPTLIAVENRYIFQIGGFEDFDYEIYALDTENEQQGWIEINLSGTIQSCQA